MKKRNNEYRQSCLTFVYGFVFTKSSISHDVNACSSSICVIMSTMLDVCEPLLVVCNECCYGVSVLEW